MQLFAGAPKERGILLRRVGKIKTQLILQLDGNVVVYKNEKLNPKSETGGGKAPQHRGEG